MIAIYELTPAPWGDQYRLVQSFAIMAYAEHILKELKMVDVDFRHYKIIEWDNR